RAQLAPGEFYAKGNYYSLARRAPFSRLVYPIPEPGGLGVHVTLDLAGQARFGPDVEWIDRIGRKEDYAVDPRRAERFYAPARRCPTARSCRAIRESAPRPPARRTPRPTSRSRARASTAFPAWCISSASSRPASRRAWRSPQPF